MIQAILLFIVAEIGCTESLFGTTFASRPIVMGALTGIFMGDMTQGVIIGAVLELSFIGSMAIGAALPPEMVSSTILSTAFAIITGKGPQIAITIALPIASMVMVLKSMWKVFILSPFVHIADRYAKNGDSKGVARMQLIGGFCDKCIMIPGIVAVFYLLGQNAMLSLLNIIPNWVQTGMLVTTGLLPAIGFGLLMEMTMNYQLICFFALGFVLSKYLQIPITGIAIFGIILAIVLMQIQNRQQKLIRNQG